MKLLLALTLTSVAARTGEKRDRADRRDSRDSDHHDMMDHMDMMSDPRARPDENGKIDHAYHDIMHKRMELERASRPGRDRMFGMGHHHFHGDEESRGERVNPREEMERFREEMRSASDEEILERHAKMEAERDETMAMYEWWCESHEGSYSCLQNEIEVIERNMRAGMPRFGGPELHEEGLDADQRAAARDELRASKKTSRETRNQLRQRMRDARTGGRKQDDDEYRSMHEGYCALKSKASTFPCKEWEKHSSDFKLGQRNNKYPL